MKFYEERVLPHIINKLCSSSPNQKQRQKIVPLAEGRVLEVGFGSGLNVPFYDASKVEMIWGLEPSEGMRVKARPLIEASDIDVELIDLPGEEIPLDTNSVDTVLVTYALCTIPDVVTALDGMRRVLKPGGRLLFCEHGKAPDEDVLRWQNRINPTWRKFSGGCNVNRDIPALLEAGGFKVETDERMYIPGLRVLCYNYWGAAVARN
jgi:ubiquinone/menaquinone biosynthesis C-methylase UbiE